MTEISPS